VVDVALSIERNGRAGSCTPALGVHVSTTAGFGDLTSRRVGHENAEESPFVLVAAVVTLIWRSRGARRLAGNGRSARRRKTLIIAMDQADMKTLDVSGQFEFAAAFICLNTYDYLLRSKSPRNLPPTPRPRHLVGPLQDGKEYTSSSGEREFASGNPFTAEDVRFTFTRLKNLKGNAVGRWTP